MTKSGDSKNTLYCSFCGKSQHEVRKLIAGPTVFICDECVDLCQEIINEESQSGKSDNGADDGGNDAAEYDVDDERQVPEEVEPERCPTADSDKRVSGK